MNSSNIDTNKSSYSTKQRNIPTILTLAFILFIEFVLIAIISCPNVTKSRTSAKRAACFSNIRLLQGAVEMYNMDKPNFMTKLDIDLLVKEKYLRNHPTPPENECIYLSEGDLTDTGKVFCKLHGSYDEEKEKELRAKEKSEHTLNKMNSFLLFIFICSIPSLIYLFFSLISGNESYICFTILFVLIVFIIGRFPQISLLLIAFQ